ncbi:MAG: hypothetical protein M3Z04_08455, partial [Chloroflexota bacterium]|nr:hypothetical protein [Chloroflexota bacterium]
GNPPTIGAYENPTLANTATVTPTVPTSTPTITLTPSNTATATATPNPCLNYDIAGSAGTIVPGTADTGNHCDDCHTGLTLPFPVTLYDQTYSTAQAGSNGDLTFGTTDETFYSGCLPRIGPTYAIFPFAVDQTTGAPGKGIYTLTTGSAPNRQFYIEWRNCRYGTATSCLAGSDNNYEVVFSEGQTSFQIVYGTFGSANATAGAIGVEKNTTVYTQAQCNAGPPASTAQTYTFPAAGCPTNTPTVTNTALPTNTATVTQTATNTATATNTPGTVNTFVTVRPSSLQGWASYDENGASHAFVIGPATPPFGIGSYALLTGAGNGTNQGGKTYFATNAYSGTLLSNISSVSYRTYVDPASTSDPNLVTAINIQLDADGNGTRDAALIFEPYYTYGPPTRGVWQTWNARPGIWWNNNAICGHGAVTFQSLSQWMSDCPAAQLVQWYPRADGYATQLVAGQTSGGGWANFIGNTDGFELGVNYNSTTYDFEPDLDTATPTPTQTATSVPTLTQTVTSVPTLTQTATAVANTATATATTCPAGQTYTVSNGSAAIVPGTTDIGNHCDDCGTGITLPFPVTLYDQTYTTAQAGSNGDLSFGTSYDFFYTGCLPNANFTYTIFPFATDQITGATGKGVFTLTTGVAPNRTFYVEWRACRYNGATTCLPNSDNNYEVVFQEGQTDYSIRYGTFGTANATVGAIGVQKNTTTYTQSQCNAGAPAATQQTYTLGCAVATATAVPNTATPAGTSTPTPTATATVCGGSVVLYDQYNNAGTNATVSQDFEAANDAFDNQAADDFVVPAGPAWTISEVDVQGVYFNGSGPAASFNVYFYQDTGTLPGTQVYAATGLAYSGSTNFVIPLPSPAVLTPGTYWLSVQARMDFTPGGEWGWTDRTVASNSGAAWRNPGGGFGTACTPNWDRRGGICGIDAAAPDQVFRLLSNAGAPCSTASATATTVPPTVTQTATTVPTVTQTATTIPTVTQTATSVPTVTQTATSILPTITLTLVPPTLTTTQTAVPSTATVTATATATCVVPQNYNATLTNAALVPGTTRIDGVGCDDCNTVIGALPFTFSLYGTSYTAATVGSNGILAFGTPNDAFGGSCFPVATATFQMMPFFRDQRTDCTSCGIFTATTGVAPNRIFSIEYHTIYFGETSTTPTLDYEVNLYENGTPAFDYTYGLINGTTQTTRITSVGVQRDATVYTQYACDSTGQMPPVATGQRLNWTLAACATPTVTGTSTATRTTTPVPPTLTTTPVPPTLTTTQTAVLSTATITPSATATVCAPTTATWVAIATIPAPGRYNESGLVASDGKFYVLTGQDSANAPLANNDVFDPTTNTWTSRSPVPSPVAVQPAVGSLSGKIFAAGGAVASAPVPTLNIYDIATDSWTPGAPAPAAFRAAMGWASTTTNRFYVFGGVDTAAAGLATTRIYDPAANTWTTGADMPDVKFYGGAAELGGLIYLFGGANATVFSNQLFAYNPVANTWTTLAAAPNQRIRLGFSARAGKLYAAGGSTTAGNSFAQSNTVDVYDIATNTWSSGPTMTIPRNTAVQGTLADGRIIAAAGLTTGNIRTQSAEVLPPDTVCVTPTATATSTAAATQTSTSTTTPTITLTSTNTATTVPTVTQT